MAEQDLMVMGVSREAVERMVSSVVEAFMVNSGALILVIVNFWQVLVVFRFYLIQASVWHQDTHAIQADLLEGGLQGVN